jgi:hypothetical protein
MPNDLGRIKLHDPRSRNYKYPVRKAIPKVSVRHRLDARHVDQFYLSGCVGYSGTNSLNTRAARKSREKFNQVIHQRFTAHFLGNKDGTRNYHESTLRDPYDWTYPPKDDGSSALGLMKFWKEIGVISRYDWTFTFDAFLAALQRQPVLVGTVWYDDMMSTDSNGIIHSSASGSGGGHEYLANAILWGKQLIGYEQSWGEHPHGFKPTFYMPFDLAEELIIHQEGDVAVPRFL